MLDGKPTQKKPIVKSTYDGFYYPYSAGKATPWENREVQFLEVAVFGKLHAFEAPKVVQVTRRPGLVVTASRDIKKGKRATLVDGDYDMVASETGYTYGVTTTRKRDVTPDFLKVSSSKILCSSKPDDGDLPWVSVDLAGGESLDDGGALFLVEEVLIWHDWTAGKTHCGQKVALSATGEFDGEEDEISVPATAESATGISVPVPADLQAKPYRYVRHWSGGTTDGGSTVLFAELSVWGKVYFGSYLENEDKYKQYAKILKKANSNCARRSKCLLPGIPKS